MKNRVYSNVFNVKKSTAISLSPKEAVQILTDYLPIKWTGVDPKTVSVTKITEGYVNTVHLVQVEGHDETRIIIRHYGGNEMSDALAQFREESNIAEIMVTKEVSDRGLGPKLYGVFPGGIILEYVDSHSITHEELKDPDILLDLAKLYARIHCLQLPLNRSVTISSLDHKVTPEQIEAAKKVIPPDEVEHLLRFHFEEEEMWVKSIFHADEMSIKLCHFDPNIANFLVKHYPKPGDLKVGIIDFELSKYSYRGFDFARFFLWGSLDTKDKKKFKIAPDLFSRKDVRWFFIQYLEEYGKRSGIRDKDKDTLDHLMVEYDIGTVYTCLEFYKIYVTQFELFYDRVPEFMAFAPFYRKMYFKAKELFISTYSGGS